MLKNPNWKPAETEVPLQEWQHILLKAADIVEQGWHQGSYCSYDHIRQKFSFCLLGAIHQAKYEGHKNPTPRSWQTPLMRQAVEKVWSTIIFGSQKAIPMPLSEWNDTPGRTKKQVVDVLRKAAKNA